MILSKRSEKELLIAHDRLASVIHNFHGAVLLEDESEKLVLTNQAFCDLFNLQDSPDQLVGKDCNTVFSHAKILFNDSRKFIFRIRQLKVQREAFINEEIELDNGEIWERDYIPVYSDKIFLGHFWIYRNVSERKEAEQIVRESEERYRLLADNMLDMVGLHMPNGVYLYVSPSFSKTLGYEEKELLGRSPYDLFHPEDITRISSDSHRKANEGEDISGFEYRIRKKNGDYIWLSTSTRPIKDEEGNVTMLQTVSRDVTERMITLQHLEALNHQKDKFFSIIAHDLRSPVSNCAGLINLLRSELTNLTSEQEMYFKYLGHSISSLQQLLDDLLLWSKSQFGKITYEPVEIFLKEEIDLIISQLIDLALAKNISIRVEIDQNLRILADRHMLDTIIRNLLSNGIKFSNALAEIIVSAEQIDDFIKISVKDSGIGINHDTLKDLFSKTIMISTRGTHGEKGSGLGLELCRDFVEMHSGKIWAESEPGKGSTFSFTLPLFRP